MHICIRLWALQWFQTVLGANDLAFRAMEVSPAEDLGCSGSRAFRGRTRR